MIKRVFFSIMIFFVITFFTNASDEISIGEVTYDNENNIKGFLAEPVDNGKYPGIILIHEWWGLNDYIKERAADFAKLGYVALAVDLYEGKSTTNRDEAKKLAAGVSENKEKAFDNLMKALEFLKNNKSVDPEKLGSIGWCFGGGWSYNIAKNNLGVNVSVIYYGRFNPKDDLSKMRALILGNFGEDDVSIKVDNVKLFQAALKTLNGDHEVYIYKNAGHAFDNKYGERYNKKASNLAWKRTIKFLGKHLK